jgi:hypothetical protein
MAMRGHLLTVLVRRAASAEASGKHQAKAWLELVPVAPGASLMAGEARGGDGGRGIDRQCSRWSCGRRQVMFEAKIRSLWDNNRWCARRNR